jgi:hypothetical protein
MLKGLNTSGRYLEVVGGTAATHVSRTYNSSSHNQGQMMYDLDSQCMKVFDGNSWIVLAGSYATVNLSYEAQSLLDWAQFKRAEERKLEKLLEEHPQLKEAYNDLKNEQEKFDLLVTLAEKFKSKPEVATGS